MNYNDFVNNCSNLIDLALDSDLLNNDCSAEQIIANRPYNALTGKSYEAHNLLNLALTEKDKAFLTQKQIEEINNKREEQRKLRLRSNFKKHTLLFYRTKAYKQQLEQPELKTFDLIPISELEKVDLDLSPNTQAASTVDLEVALKNANLTKQSSIKELIEFNENKLNSNANEPVSVTALKLNIAAFELCSKFGLDYSPIHIEDDQKALIREYLTSDNNKAKFFEDIHRIYQEISTASYTKNIVDKSISNTSMSELHADHRIDLNVPYSERLAAKELGAKWDQNARTWYIENNQNIDLFNKWLEPIININKVEQKTDIAENGRYYLNVPYEQRDFAKSNGARWDQALKSWYITDKSKLVILKSFYDENYCPDANNIKNIPQKITERTYLNVPFNEIDLAKKAGAWYDRDLKAWYVPHYKKLDDFAQWYDPNFDPKSNRTVAIYDTNAALEDFRNVLIRAGADPTVHIISDNRSIQRIHAVGDNAGSKNIAYQLYTDGVPNGWVKNFKTGFEEKFIFNGNRRYEQITVAELEARRAEIARKQAENEAKHIKSINTAAQYATDDFNNASILDFSDNSTYLAKKGIDSSILNKLHHLDNDFNVKYSTYQNDDKQLQYKNLIFPLRNIDGDIRSLQTIQTDGTKRIGYTKSNREFVSSQKQGCFYHIGDIEHSNRIFITEGIATAMTVAAATNTPTIAAIDSGNLISVIDVLKKSNKFKNTEFIIAADNDIKNVFEGKSNVGVMSALNCQEAHNDIKIVYPRFLGSESNCSDFNDLYTNRKSLTQVKDQIDIQLENINNKTDSYYVYQIDKVSKIGDEKEGKLKHEVLLGDNAGIQYRSFITDTDDLRVLQNALDNRQSLTISSTKQFLFDTISKKTEIYLDMHFINKDQKLDLNNQNPSINKSNQITKTQNR